MPYYLLFSGIYKAAFMNFTDSSKSLKKDYFVEKFFLSWEAQGHNRVWGN